MRSGRIYKTAGLTIELSLLMPGIIAILIFIIFAGYYYHDKCIIERGAYSAVLRGTKEKDSSLNELFSDETDLRLIGKWDIEIEDDSDSLEKIISVKGTMKSFDTMFMKYLGGEIFSIELTERAYIMHETEYVRGY